MEEENIIPSEETINNNTEEYRTPLEILKENLKSIEPYSEFVTKQDTQEQDHSFADPSQMFEDAQEQHFTR